MIQDPIMEKLLIKCDNEIRISMRMTMCTVVMIFDCVIYKRLKSINHLVYLSTPTIPKVDLNKITE